MGNIVLSPYNLNDSEELLKLEQLCPQGTNFSLRFVRPTFHACSEVYEDYKIITAKVDGKLVGVTAASKKNILMRDRIIKAIYGYDLRVHPNFRKYGTARILTKNIIEMFGDEIDCLYSFVSGENERALNFVKRNFGARVSIPLTYLIIPVFRKLRQKEDFEFSNPTDITNNYLIQNPNLVFISRCDEKYLLGHVNSIKMNNGAGCSIWTNKNLISEQVDNIPLSYDMMRFVFNNIRPFLKLPVIPHKSQIIKSWFLYDLYAKDIDGLKNILAVVNNLAFSKGRDFVYILLQNDNPLISLIKKLRLILFSQPYWFIAKGNFFPQESERIYIDIRDL